MRAWRTHFDAMCRELLELSAGEKIDALLELRAFVTVNLRREVESLMHDIGKRGTHG